MQNPGYTIRSLSWLSALLLLVVLVLVNVVCARTVLRVDLTEERLYTLSDGTRRILEKLEDPAAVKVFWGGIPARFDSTRRYLQALLEEMQGVAGDRLRVEWVDMDDEEGPKEAAKYEIEEWSFGSRSGGEQRVSKGYMSFVVEMGGEKAAVFNAFFSYEEKLEFILASTLAQRSSQGRPVLAIVTSAPPASPFSPRQPGRFTVLQQTLTETYGSSLRTYLTLDDPIPSEVDVLFLPGPKNLEPKQVYHVEQFVLRGGRLLLYLDPANIDNVWRAQFGAEPDASGLEDWLAHLGVTIERGAIGDFDSKAVTRYPLPPDGKEWRTYAYWFMTDPSQHDETNPVTRDLPPVTLFWPAPISVDEARQAEAGRTVKVLMRTSASGYRRPDLVNLNQALESGEGKSLESLPLLLMIDGPMTSFWKGKPLPGSEEEGAGGEEPESGDGDDPSGEPGEPEPAPGAAEANGEAAPPAEQPEGEPSDEPGGAPKEGDGDEAADATEAAGGATPARLEEGRGRILLATDAEFVSNTFGPTSGLSEEYGLAGYDMTIRATGWLSGDDDLLEVPIRGKNPRRLEEQSAADQRMIRVVNVIGVPLLIFLIGLTVFIIRRF